MKLFGTSGIRRLADRDLIELALKIGLAMGTFYNNVVVGRDTRTSSDTLQHSFMAGVLAGGSWCYDAGVIPTPTLALAAREFQAGAMITASHNPPEYNGIKLLNPDGSAFNSSQQEQIESFIENNSLPIALWSDIKSSSVYSEAVEKHIERILRNFNSALKLKVALDCGCGAASVITPHLLDRLGCEVVALNCQPNGIFPHDIEPTENNLADLIRTTRDISADVGITHDGDGDRMMAVDNNGRFIPGDKLLVLFAQQTGAREVVTTIDASMAIDEMGFSVTRTPVGDNYVSEELKRGGDFGGEPSGSWIFPDNSLAPDGIYAAARLLSIARENRVSQLIDNIPNYHLLRGSVTNNGLVISDLEESLMVLSPLSVSKIDGIKLIFKDGWLLIRASGTEPKIRITAEAKSQRRVQELYNSGVMVISECIERGKEE